MPRFMNVCGIVPNLGRFLFYVFECALYRLFQGYIGVDVFCMHV